MGIHGENLEVIYGKQKSFYGKAKVRETLGMKILRSYDTDVAAVTSDGEFHRIWEGEYIRKQYGIWGTVEEFQEWTATTGKHIREFARQFAGKDIKKADYVKLQVEGIPELMAKEAVKKVIGAKLGETKTA